MMSQMKHAIAFILGVLYASCIWLMLKDLGWNIETWVLMTALVIATMLIIMMVIIFFVKNWRKR